MESLSYGVGVERTPALISAYRLTRFYHLPPEENRGRQNVYVRVWDAEGRRLQADGLRIKAVGFTTQYIPLDKASSPMETGHGDVPLWANDTLTISIIDKLNHESDRVVGLHTRHPDEGNGNSYGHHSFLLEFTLRAVGEVPPTLPPEREHLFQEFRRWLDDGKNIIDELEKLG